MKSPSDFSSLREKLEYLEALDVYFQAGYYGKDEVLIARLPDLSFIDYHWLDSNEDGTRQFFRPTEFERIVDDTISHVDGHGFVKASKLWRGDAE